MRKAKIKNSIILLFCKLSKFVEKFQIIHMLFLIKSLLKEFYSLIGQEGRASLYHFVASSDVYVNARNQNNR